jgi:hypothetical protein
MAQRFTGLAISPVPVLLPFDTNALLRDQAAGTATAGNERYLSGFHAATFFYPGPAGYDAAFAIRAHDVPELSDVKFKEPIEVQISGSAVLYELDQPIATNGQPVAELEAEFPSIICATPSCASACPMSCRSAASTPAFRAIGCRPAAPPIGSRCACCGR